MNFTETDSDTCARAFVCVSSWLCLFVVWCRVMSWVAVLRCVVLCGSVLLRAVSPIVCYTWVLGRKAHRTNSQLVPSAVSLKITGADQLHQVKRMI